MKNVLSLTPGSISIISDKRELAGMGEIRMEEKRHSFFVKNTNKSWNPIIFLIAQKIFFLFR